MKFQMHVCVQCYAKIKHSLGCLQTVFISVYGLDLQWVKTNIIIFKRRLEQLKQTISEKSKSLSFVFGTIIAIE